MNERNDRVKKLLRRAAAGLLACAMLMTAQPLQPAQAAVSGTTTLRILSTTDLHGQSVNINYDSATERKTGSLAQAATLIKNLKSSLKYGSTLLVDIGDSLYGYGTDMIHAGNVEGPEYLYEEMAALGYDALTVGNHDFDYGYQYLMEQLDESGLSDKVVVSNIYDAKTKKNVWAENRVITKKLKMTNGRSVSVRIGLIGVTTPKITTHYDHSLLLTSKDMAASVEEQVGKLQKKNVDLIVVMAHSGIGAEDEYVQNIENAAYEISKIDGVDAIVGGHAHVNFPSTDANVQKFYAYKDISADGKLHGVPYAAVADHGAGVGMIDLKLKITNGRVTVAGSSAKVKKVKASTASDAQVVAINDRYQEQLDALYDTTLAEVDGTASTYFAPIEDNIVIQLANEAKIHYGLEFIYQTKPKYQNTPVIAATSYGMSGRGKPDDVVLDGAYTIGDTLKIQNKNKEFAYIYLVTGDDIREWLEWQASAYQNPEDVADTTWSDKTMQKYAQSGSLTPVLNPEWTDDWSGFLVFDGIEYEMDPTGAARYDKSGKLINKKAHRITSLTCNGKEVADNMTFALVCPRLNNVFCKVATSRSEYLICNERVYLNDLVQDYLKDQNGYAPLSAKPDNNWNVLFPEADNYVMKLSAASRTEAESRSWYEKTLKQTTKALYCQMSLDESAATEGSAPMLVAGIGKTKQTNQGVTIAVQASDRAGIRSVKYAAGVQSTDSDAWYNAAAVTGRSFTVHTNGVYTVMAEDTDGHRTVKYVTVENCDDTVLETPNVKKCTNRSSVITGTAEAGTTVYVKAGGVTYSAAVAEDGTFSIATPKLAADSVVTLWVTDESGRRSADLQCTVKRTGANEPVVDAVSNKSHAITGTLNDSKYCKVIAFSGDTVYVPENGGLEAYENCSVYDFDKKVVPVKYEVSDGVFSLSIPVPLAGTKYTVYSLDWTDANSVKKKVVAEEVAPNQPKLTQLYAADGCVYGRIPKTTSDAYEIRVSDGNATYTGTAGADGYFAVAVGSMPEGTELTVTAADLRDGKTRTSAKATVTVASCDALPMPTHSDIVFDEIDSKTTTVSGRMDDTGRLDLLIGSTHVSVKTAEDGMFSYTLKTPRAAGTSIVALMRDADGSILDANRTSVTLALPDEPVLLTETVYDTSETVEVLCADRATAVVKIGKKYYKSQTCKWDDELGGYVYTLTIKKQPKAGEAVIVYMMNATGKSTKVQTVVAADPDAKKQNE